MGEERVAEPGGREGGAVGTDLDGIVRNMPPERVLVHVAQAPLANHILPFESPRLRAWAFGCEPAGFFQSLRGWGVGMCLFPRYNEESSRVLDRRPLSTSLKMGRAHCKITFNIIQYWVAAGCYCTERQNNLFMSSGKTD